jgi:ABC-2 type transport system permease protein
MSFPAIRALIRNDLRIYATDRRAIVIGVLVPILIAAFFGYVFGGSGSSEVGKIPIDVVDEDQSAVSRAVVADLSQDPLLSSRSLDRTGAEQQVRAGKAQVAVILPHHFAADAAGAMFRDEGKPNIEFLIDPSQTLSGRIVEGVLVRRVIQEITREAARSSSGPNAPREFSVPYAISTTQVTSGSNVAYNAYAHSFAGMTTQFILLAGIDAGIVLLLLRERGLWQRMRAAPLSKAQFLVARTSATMLISLFQFALIYLVAISVFGVRVAGSLTGFLGLALSLCFMNSAFGLMLAALGRSAPATRGIAVLVTLLLVMIGGAWVPSFVFPKWLQQASLAVPTRWAVDGLDAVTWRGQGLSAALAPMVVLGASAIICLAIAVWRFRWEE